jgi:thiamine-phosphate pyrophosphorylase
MNTDKVLRLIDANFNRAREAARVVEDYARFVLDRPDLSAAAKNIRHDLTEAIRQSVDAQRLPLYRDVANDVGRDIKTEAEGTRGVPADVLAANFKRLQESLRSLEEAAKLMRWATARDFESLRYRSYELETQMLKA